jgi:hypothetical protein
MKSMALAIIAASVLAILASSITAANAGPKHSREECMQIARQRGFTSGDRNANEVFRNFAIACMQGKQN